MFFIYVSKITSMVLYNIYFINLVSRQVVSNYNKNLNTKK